MPRPLDHQESAIHTVRIRMHVKWDRCVYEETYAWVFVQDFDGVAVEDSDTGASEVSKAEIGE